jgi:hypothetical protein
VFSSEAPTKDFQVLAEVSLSGKSIQRIKHEICVSFVAFVGSGMDKNQDLGYDHGLLVSDPSYFSLLSIFIK